MLTRQYIFIGDVFLLGGRHKSIEPIPDGTDSPHGVYICRRKDPGPPEGFWRLREGVTSPEPDPCFYREESSIFAFSTNEPDWMSIPPTITYKD